MDKNPEMKSKVFHMQTNHPFLQIVKK
ncbi:rCG43059 [Rattus norvegicus]|uniref:RCG43059 n=1 Tax=Rattus norvegicus TaxID=10116 RepID=A6IVP0_RAT|nr:rCG43059 [Rattus norvegicus]